MHPYALKELAELRIRDLRSEATEERLARSHQKGNTSRPNRRKGMSLRAAALILAVLTLVLVACAPGVQSYEDFRSAVDRGATCEQLIDINEDTLLGAADEKRVARDLREIGCFTRSSTRTDGK